MGLRVNPIGQVPVISGNISISSKNNNDVPQNTYDKRSFVNFSAVLNHEYPSNYNSKSAPKSDVFVKMNPEEPPKTIKEKISESIKEVIDIFRF